MKRLIIFLAFISSSFLAISQASYEAKADELLTNAMAQKAFIGVAAGFAVDGEIKWKKGLGFNDLNTNNQFTPNTLNRTASIVKPMTAISIMQLFEQGKIDLEAPVQTYLPDFPKKGTAVITIRHLLNHSSGIDAYKSKKEMNNKKNYANLAAAVNLFKDRDLIAKPGTQFNYTTYGYVVLGLVIEQVSGMTFEAYLKKHIWDIAGMDNTAVEYFDKTYPNKSNCFHKNNKGKIKTVKKINLSDRIPGGGVNSCITDLLKFGNAILNNSLIKASTLEMMIQDSGLKKEGNPYGLGWYLYGINPKHGNVFGHTGAQLGCSAIFMLLPDQHTVIIVLSNTSGAGQEVANIAIPLFDIAAESK